MNAERQGLLGLSGSGRHGMESYKISFLPREVPISNGPKKQTEIVDVVTKKKDRKHCIYLSIAIVVFLLIVTGAVVAVVAYTHRDRGTSNTQDNDGSLSVPQPSPLPLASRFHGPQYGPHGRALSSINKEDTEFV